jgi:hypothetical protein
MVWVRAFFFLSFAPVALAAWVGCSSHSSEDSTTPDANTEGGTNEPTEGGVDGGAARDCSGDVADDGLPTHLECTGLYDNFAAKSIASDVMAYTPALQFWSDGAIKSRFLYLPPDSKIDISNFDQWHWPVGTKVWKEFKLGDKRIETRLFTKTETAWKRTVYRFTDDESDAVRKEIGEKVPVDGKPAYEIPSTGSCDLCHGGRAEPLLGLEPVSLGLAEAKGVTIASLAEGGRFNAAPPETSLAIPDDPSIMAGRAPLAMGWLHANCGSCHNASPGATAGVTNLFFLLHASELAGGTDARTLDAYKAVCKKASRLMPDSGTAYTLIAGKNPSASLVSILSGERAPDGVPPTSQTQMPPIVSHVVDVVGHSFLDDWIMALATCP